MKKLKNVIILFLVLINSFFQDVLFLPSNSKQVKVLYGIDNEFTNCNKGIDFLLSFIFSYCLRLSACVVRHVP